MADAEEKKQEKVKEEALQAPAAETKKHVKKIAALSLKEVEQKLKETGEKMGGLHSRYAQALLRQKEHLLRSVKA